jgi:hypothetical protein
MKIAGAFCVDGDPATARNRSGSSESHRRDPIAERLLVRIASAEDDHHIAFAVESCVRD